MGRDPCPDCGHPQAHHLSGFCFPEENVECPCERTFGQAPRANPQSTQGFGVKKSGLRHRK